MSKQYTVTTPDHGVFGFTATSIEAINGELHLTGMSTDLKEVRTVAIFAPGTWLFAHVALSVLDGSARLEFVPNTGIDPRRRQYWGGIWMESEQVRYGDEQKTIQEWAKLIAPRVCHPERLSSTQIHFTEKEFLDYLDMLPELEMYT